MKFNMGCGLNRMDGYVNVDAAPDAGADEVWDLETTPWPWATSCAQEVRFIHSLEHMGGDPKVFLAIMQELYRICAPGAKVVIHVPHPRHDVFLGDPTHVRVITPNVMSLFNRRLNEEWAKLGAPNTPLALYTGVDFQLIETRTIVDEPYLSQFRRGELSQAGIDDMIRRQNNIASAFHMTLEVRKSD